MTEGPASGLVMVLLAESPIKSLKIAIKIVVMPNIFMIKSLQFTCDKNTVQYVNIRPPGYIQFISFDFHNFIYYTVFFVLP